LESGIGNRESGIRNLPGMGPVPDPLTGAWPRVARSHPRAEVWAPRPRTPSRSVQDAGWPALDRVVDGPGEQRREVLLLVGRPIRLVDGTEDPTRLLPDGVHGRPTLEFFADGEERRGVDELLIPGQDARPIHRGQGFHEHINPYRINLRSCVAGDHGRFS